MPESIVKKLASLMDGRVEEDVFEIQYKANRDEMPDDLKPQIPYLKKLAEHLGVAQVAGVLALGEDERALLALVGDAADGYPGVPGWGAKSAATVLARYKHLEAIPKDPAQLGLGAARGQKLVESLAANQQEVLLFRRLSTLRDDVPLREKVADLEWQGAHPALRQLCQQLGEKNLPERITRWQAK